MASKSIVRLLQNSSKLRCRSLSPTFTVACRCYSSWEPKDEETHTGQVSKNFKSQYFVPVDSRLRQWTPLAEDFLLFIILIPIDCLPHVCLLSLCFEQQISLS